MQGTNCDMLTIEPNYDEAKVPRYQLPDPLCLNDGTRVDTPALWHERRRPELLHLFGEHIYGHMPQVDVVPRYQILEESSQAMGGLATRRQVRIWLGPDKTPPHLDLLIYIPNRPARPVPTFLGLNFFGNHTVWPDPTIHLSKQWMRPDSAAGVIHNRATVAARGIYASRWSVIRLIERGYGLATLYCGDADPDFDDGFQNGVHPLFARTGAPSDCGTIGAWAWSLSRALDYLEIDSGVDAHRVAVIGHSRLGKTALWAAACDQRFAMAISNNSGCGGAALFRRCFGETIATMSRSFPHWCCSRFAEYAGRDSELPVDQHELLALIAPRPVYVASSQEDPWADPRGEFLSAVHAGVVYELLGAQPLPDGCMPDVHDPRWATIGYHLRAGKHAITPYDWEQFMTFADHHL